MSRILVVAEIANGAVRDITHELVGAANAIKAGLGAAVVVAVADPDPSAHVADLDHEGVDEIVTVPVPGAPFEAHAAEAVLDAIVEDVDPAVVLLGHTVDALAVAPALAARRGYGLATDVTGVDWDGELIARRPAHGGKLTAELTFAAAPRVILLGRPGAFVTPSPATGATTRELAVEPGTPRAEHLGFVEDAGATDVDITTADFLLAVGRGLEDESGLKQFEELADQMGAVLSASRPLVDAGWVSSARQVGQSGKTVAPRVYLAFGISGAVQHLAGIQKADTVIAVNTDANAPIFGVARYGAVADMFDVADELARCFDSVQA
jgi:electron transfer flavoprotein alpha subunit